MSAVSVDRIVEYLRATFSKPPLGRLAKIFGDSPEYSYRVRGIESYSCTAAFKSVSIVWVEVEGTYLDFTLLPRSCSKGLFAVCNRTGEVWYLQQSNPLGLQKVLQAEGTIAHITANCLAQLVCDGLLSHRNNRHRLLSSFSDIVAMTTKSTLGSGYTIDDVQSKRICNVIEPAKITFEGKLPILEFFTLNGWMHKCGEVQKITLRISSDFSLLVSSQVCSTAIFSAMPQLLY